MLPLPVHLRTTVAVTRPAKPPTRPAHQNVHVSSYKYAMSEEKENKTAKKNRLAV